MEEEVGRRALAKATRRLIPFLFGIYVVAYLDRVNVSFAQLQLEDDLGFTDTIFGLGAGIFSLGYVIFGVPSNLALARFGARRWLAAIMVVWGILSASHAVHQQRRRLLRCCGSCSARPRRASSRASSSTSPGGSPSRSAPARSRCSSRRSPWPTWSGGPISGGLLELDGFLGLDGWQWLFLCEGLPAIGLGIFTLRYLDEGPEEAEWLEPEERDFLVRELARERAVMEEAPGAGRVGEALVNGQVWLLGLIYFILLAAGFGLTFFVPDLVQDRTGYSDFEVGVLAARAVRDRHGGHARGGPARRARRQPQALHRRARADRRGRHRSHGARAVAGPAHGRHLPRGDRAPRGHPGLLGAAHGVPERRGRRGGHRADRGARQPRRLRRAGVHRDLRGLHGRVRDAADRARRPARGGRAAGVRGARELESASRRPRRRRRAEPSRRGRRHPLRPQRRREPRLPGDGRRPARPRVRLGLRLPPGGDVGRPARLPGSRTASGRSRG